MRFVKRCVAPAAAALLVVSCSDDGGTSDRHLADPSAVEIDRGDRIVVADQRSDGTDVLVDEVVIADGGGYVVVYRDVGGAPGERLGASALLGTGAHQDVLVPLDPAVTQAATVFVLLHGEGDGDDVLTWPGADEPLADDAGVLTARVELDPTR